MSLDGGVVAALFTGLATLILAIGKVILDLRQVHKAVNSNMEAAMKEIKGLNKRIEGLIREQGTQ